MATCPKCGTRYASTVRICTHDGTVLNDEPVQDPRVGKLLDGKYRLDAFLSHGGMGAVYKATHIMLDKTVAVKLIKPELVTSAEIVRRFQREARAASNLNHPNIVAVYDLGQTDDGTLYIAMEYIDGPSLKDVIRKTGAMPVERINGILRQVASALSLAHNHNIIHRDLKPHNVMLAKGTGGQEVAKLLDFGIAKTFDEAGPQLTQTGFALGTPQYMAPEQAAGKEVTAQSDLYSLGVMLYEMLIGEVPFDAPTTAAILIKQLTEAPQPPSRRKPEARVSPVLESVALRCLDKDPEKRFPTADAFAEALGRADATIAAPSETPTRLFAAPTDLAPSPVPGSRSATTVGAPVPAASPAPTDKMSTESPAPPAYPGAVPPSVAPMAATPAPAPVADARSNSGTRPTVPAPAPMAAAPQAAPTAKRTGLWVTLGAVAVLVLAVAAMQLGLIPSGPGGSNTTGTPPQSAPAPQASPAAADAPAPVATRTPDPSSTAAASASRTEAPSATPTASRSSAAASNAAPTAGARPTIPAAASPAAANPPAAPERPAPATANRAEPAPSTTPTPSPATAPPSRAARPENPPIFFRCEGVPAVCNALRASLFEALQKHNLPPVRDESRAAIILTGNVDIVQERVSRDFGTAMQTRTYTVDVSGEAKDGTPISMPAPRTFSFDAQYGRERLDENVRLIAADVVEKIRAYWNK